MARRYLSRENMEEKFGMTQHQIYKLVRRPRDPLPHRKIGKLQRFDEEQVHKWFLRQPGTDGEDFDF